MKSVMHHDFSRIPTTDMPRSTFDRSHGLKTAFDSGLLVPIEVQEVLPGDTVDMDAKFLARTPQTVAPIMDNVFFDTQWFFCPSRLLWNNFTKMMGEQVNPNDSIDYLVPQITAPAGGFAVGSLADYFGIPTGIGGLKVNALPFRMYQKVWDDWYRDENLQNSVIQSSDDLGDAEGSIAWNTLRRRGKRHDYFTSALPWTQKGQAIQLPLGDYADAYGSNTALAVGGISHVAPNYVFKDQSTNALTSTTTTEAGEPLRIATKEEYEAFGVNGAPIKVDLSTATSATINSLRMAFQLQRLLETSARSGTRYCELIRGFFHTVCPDARLQRSEYLGGSSTQIGFAPTVQTSASSSDDTPQGNIVSNGKVVSECRWTKSFTEHGYIIGLANVRCDLNYQQGLDRLWSRRGRYDFFWPVLQNLGEQAVLNKEIFCQGESVKDELGQPIDDKVFGYQERYAEYRYNPSRITGKLRSTASSSLDVWHLAQKFDALPTLSDEFIQDNPPLKRVLAITDEPEIILDAYLAQKWTRPMQTYSIPGLVDHL